MEKIELDYLVPSGNSLLREHWANRQRRKITLQWLIRKQMMDNRIVSVFKPTICKLQLIVFRKRLLDYDNLVSGCKSLLDALVCEGFIVDDSMRYLDIEIIPRKQTDANPKVFAIRTIINDGVST